MEHATTFILLAGAFGLFMAWGIGANDVANAMGTSVGSGALTIRQAVIIAAVFEFTGAVLAGGQVTSTIRKGIVDPALFAANPELLIFGMLASLLAAGIWLLVASKLGWPVSTTHTIVGAIVGFAAVGVGIEAVQWGKVGSIAASWVVSPLMSGVIAYGLFESVRHLILDSDAPLRQARRWVPVYIFLVGFTIALVTMLKGLQHVGLEFSFVESIAVSVLFGVAALAVGRVAIARVRIDPQADNTFHFANVEKIFTVLMIVTACAMAFAHGSNDVANAIGPVAAVVSVVQAGGSIAPKAATPVWILLIGAAGIVAGLAMYGHKVMATIGTRITMLTPSHGFAATLAAAVTVVLASGTGLPISTTHTLVGAVLGVGLARGIGAIDLRVVSNIVMSWLVTLPAGAILSIVFFYVLQAVLG